MSRRKVYLFVGLYCSVLGGDGKLPAGVSKQEPTYLVFVSRYQDTAKKLFVF